MNLVIALLTLPTLGPAAQAQSRPGLIFRSEVVRLRTYFRRCALRL